MRDIFSAGDMVIINERPSAVFTIVQICGDIALIDGVNGEQEAYLNELEPFNEQYY